MDIIKKLSRSIREYKMVSIMTPVCIVFEVIFEILIPFMMAKMIDSGISSGNESALVKYGTLLILCVMAGLVFGILSGGLCATASAGFAKNLRKDMYYKIQEYSFANIDKFSSSSIVTRLTTDVTNVQNAYMMIIRIAVRAPFMLIFALIATFMTSTKLSLIFLIAIPVLGIGLYIIVSRSHIYFERVFKIYDNLNEVVEENLTGMRVVKSFVREDFEEKKFTKVSEAIYKMFLKAEGIVAYNMPLMQFCIYSCMLFLCWFGARMIITSGATALTTGELTSLIAYAMTILNCLMMLSMVMVMINMARASAERIVEILDEESTLHNCDNPEDKVNDGSIQLSFSYIDDKEKECLKNINLIIPSGSTLGIIGGTGSGKSSLVQLIPRLYDVTEGSVKIGGVDVRDIDIYTLRNEVAMVLQKNVLFSGTIKENLRWGNKEATDEEIIHACELAQADPFVQTFPKKYNTYIEQGGTNVSGGQKQRLCIARALLKKPKILILDDSTSAVDTKTDALIRKAFKDEIPDTTKIIIAQRISSVQDADCIIVMEGGKIDGCGTHEQLLKENAIYKEIYESQTKGDEQ
jgi:ATP-binding cassette subfamily B multidrug efflux pump